MRRRVDSAPLSAMMRYLGRAAVLAPCYLVLDWASYIAPVGPFNITPWNPQPGLAITWMTLLGARYGPVVWGAIVAADVLVRGVPGGWAITLLGATILASGYMAIAWTLRAHLPERMFRSTSDLTVFVLLGVAGTAIVALAFVASLALGGLLGDTPLLQAWVRFWLGDAVGTIVTAPLLFALASAEHRTRLSALARRGEAVAQLGLLLATLWLVFAGLGGDPLWHFHLLFLPLIWIAVRHGLAGAVVASVIVQAGVVAALRIGGGAETPVWELQALVAALTLTGLYLGMTENEREAATRKLGESLRLAAAGEMAGAIAHELNQPLTALSNYGNAALVVSRQPDTDPRLIGAIIERMLGESQRAADVVRRLRDFFRSGTTSLEVLDVDEIAAVAARVGKNEIGERAIALDVSGEAGLPPVLADRLQLELVLRNLIANASDAAADATDGPRVGVRAERHDPKHIRIVVSDNGPGIAASARARLFEPFVSGKPTGMGLGLAVSRAIAVAHGGDLYLQNDEGAEFHLVLPFTEAE